MRKVNFDSVEVTEEGSFQQIPAGAYVCAITGMRDVESKEYFEVLADIIQGEHANYFTDRFYADKPWAHRIIMSYKDTALGMLKGRLQTISACSPGFDAEAAWNGGNLRMFEGKAVGVVFRQEEYLDKKTGEFKLGAVRPDRLCALDALAEPKNAAPAPKMMTDEQKRDARERAGIYDPTPSVPADLYSEDVPF